MSKLICTFVGLGVAVASAPAQAQTQGGFELGAELFDYGYRERFEGETIVFDDGTFGGGRLDYVETIGGGTFLRSRLHVAFGSVDYRDMEGDRLDDVSQDIGQLELQIGHDVLLGKGATLTPFVGLGGRLLDDRSGGKETTGGAAGYDREISYSYIPIGAAVAFGAGKGIEVEVSGQYNWLVDGHARSKLGVVDARLPNLRLDIDEGHGLEASAMFRVYLGGNRLGFGPFIRHWNVDRSAGAIIVNPENAAEQIEFFEPANRTTELGLRIGFAF